MPSTSEAQARFMAACSHGAGYDRCPPAKVSKEFNQADKGSSLLSNAMRPHHAFGGGIGSRVSLPHLGGAHGPGGATEVARPMSPSVGSPWWTRSAAHEVHSPPHMGGIGRQHMAPGGMMSPSMASPWWERSEARISDVPFHGGGLIPGSGAGRTDRLPLSVASESHVIPSDVVSSLGQGTTDHGAKIIQGALGGGTAPYGVPIPKSVHGRGPPSPPHPSGAQPGLAEGGNAATSILAASGEFVVRPDLVRELGQRGIAQGLGKKGEDPMDAGHRLLDEMIHNVRQFQIRWLKTAPKPKK